MRSLGEHEAGWRAARAAAAAEPRYRRLDLVPQVGLVPLGADPATGLLEFSELCTGTPPRRDAAGRLLYQDDSSVVFVLVPGGSCCVGAQAGDLTGSNYWPGAKPDEGPVQRVELQPFLIAKHEMTQSQWQRLAGYNPSLSIGTGSARHPVGHVELAGGRTHPA